MAPRHGGAGDAHWGNTPEDAGSSPARDPIPDSVGIAQQDEHRTSKPAYAGSNPAPHAMPHSPDLGLTLQPVSPEDMPWIYSTWIKSYRDSPYGKSHEQWEDYAQAQIDRVNWLLSHGATLYVARGQVPGWLAGWVCCQPKRDRYVTRYVLHYAYVRGGVWRKQGIGTWLLNESSRLLSLSLSNPKPVFTHYRQPGASLLLARGFECRDDWGHA